MPRGGRKKLLEEYPELTGNIAALIRAGAWDYIAAEANGVSQRIFYGWLEQGRKDEDAGLDTIHSQFLQEIDGAKAEARIVAENAVKTTNPLAYLRLGPGRQRPGRPGWTDQTAITDDEGGKLRIILKRERAADETDDESEPD